MEDSWCSTGWIDPGVFLFPVGKVLSQQMGWVEFNSSLWSFSMVVLVGKISSPVCSRTGCGSEGNPEWPSHPKFSLLDLGVREILLFPKFPTAWDALPERTKALGGTSARNSLLRLGEVLWNGIVELGFMDLE